MIRVIYRWTVKPGEEEQFIRDWQAGTRKIQDNCAGAHGSFLIRDRKNPEHFFGVARWESDKAWRVAQPVMATLNLPGPTAETADFFDEHAEMLPTAESRAPATQSKP
jgi:hypothetical protein